MKDSILDCVLKGFFELFGRVEARLGDAGLDLFQFLRAPEQFFSPYGQEFRRGYPGDVNWC